ncbi:MAG: hypothetical protein HUU20_24145 [Pirellulales bacterium]|nr:hypothetical protein [Pirellulales bacterium]
MSSAARILGLCVVFLALSGASGLGSDAASFCSPALCDGYGYGWWPWSLYSREYIPYHALYPPVYYSYPVPRTYGYSPFAYPPGTRTPEVAPPAPLTVPNPYVAPKPEPKPASHRVTRSPLRIQNPFVAQSERPAAAEPDALTAHEGSRAQVVYPARLQ